MDPANFFWENLNPEKTPNRQHCKEKQRLVLTNETANPNIYNIYLYLLAKFLFGFIKVKKENGS